VAANKKRESVTKSKASAGKHQCPSQCLSVSFVAYSMIQKFIGDYVLCPNRGDDRK
jgi:hypothetical protein